MGQTGTKRDKKGQKGTNRQKREQRRERTKARRLLFVSLCEEMESNLCMICKNSEHEHDGCCEGYTLCAHPSESICEMHEEGLDPGMDCWAFRSRYPLDTVIELTSAVIIQGFKLWAFRIYSKTELTLYGFHSRPGEDDVTAKVRIGHNGKPREEDMNENNTDSPAR